MPSKRKPTRAAQLQPLPTQSDYDDTDTAAITDGAQALEPPPKRTNTELNLLVLRRYDPRVEHIIDIAPFAVVYTFSPESQQWEKCGVEGTLFVCHLTGGRYNVIILNRKSLDNFTTELVSADDVEITEEYVILQVVNEEGAPQIYGLWVYSDGETVPSTRERIAQTILDCTMRVQITSEAVADPEDEVYDANGYTADGQVYDLDGTSQIQHQLGKEEAVSQQAGKQLDLLQFFSRKPTQGDGQSAQASESGVGPSAAPSAFGLPARFTSTADTDLFRSSHSPAAQQQQRAAGPPAQQQSALLDLFKR